MLVRNGTLDEALQVLQDVDELAQDRARASYQSRLDGRRHLVLVAEQGNRLVGFKVGYELDPELFYSWIGGIHPGHRRQGIAQALLQTQHRWAASEGYRRIQVKTSMAFPQMRALLQRNGYQLLAEQAGRLLYQVVLAAPGQRRR